MGSVDIVGRARVTAEDRAWLRRAIELSRGCPPVTTAYNVGAVIVCGDVVVAEGYSRDIDGRVHAEESALRRWNRRGPAGAGLATMYTSLEPCTSRRSRRYNCTQMIMEAGIRRVVLALREPTVFVRCEGVGRLAAAGIEVIEVEDLADEVMALNAHLLGGHPGG
jgi:diaminohydroxyphosphoribosylaminopyrimidine deaminase / 5-amino-6-(5-phosphoribosylamino)uracil reductase